MASMLLGLGTDETQKKPVRQIAKNLKTCGGRFSCLISPQKAGHLQGMEVMEGDNGRLLPVLEPQVARDATVVLV
jgi:hypothetical protein